MKPSVVVCVLLKRYVVHTNLFALEAVKLEVKRGGILMKKKSMKKKSKIRLSEIKTSKSRLLVLWIDTVQAYQDSIFHPTPLNILRVVKFLLRLVLTIAIRKFLEWLFSFFI